jgi:hypothetical protein
VELGWAGAEDDPGAIEAHAAELRRALGRGESRWGTQRGGPPGRRGRLTQLDLVERLGPRGQRAKGQTPAEKLAAVRPPTAA